MSNIIKTLLPYLLLVLVTIFLIFYLQNKIKSKEEQFLLKQQILLSQNNELKKVNDRIYFKYYEVKNLNDSLDKEIKSLNVSLIQKTNLIVKLNNQIQQGFGNIINNDSNDDKICFNENSIFEFFGSNELRDYKLQISFKEKKPFHQLSENYNIFELNCYMTRNKNGSITGYTSVPESLKDLITFSKVNFYLQNDFFNENDIILQEERVFHFSLLYQYNFPNNINYFGGLFEYKKYGVGYTGNFKNQHNLIVSFNLF